MMTWFLFQTKPNREHYAAENVHRQNYRFMLPEYLDRQTGKISILFPSYLFVGFNRHHQSIQPILSTYGISSVVRMGEAACPVRPDVIRQLRDARDKVTKLTRLPSPRRHYRFNQRVRIVEGAFLDQIARYQYANTAEQRVYVLLSLMGCKAAVWLDERQVAAA